MLVHNESSLYCSPHGCLYVIKSCRYNLHFKWFSKLFYGFLSLLLSLQLSHIQQQFRLFLPPKIPKKKQKSDNFLGNNSEGPILLSKYWKNGQLNSNYNYFTVWVYQYYFRRHGIIFLFAFLRTAWSHFPSWRRAGFNKREGLFFNINIKREGCAYKKGRGCL